MINTQILNPELIFHNIEGHSKKRLLETLAKDVAQIIPNFDANELFDNLIAREKLGSTGLGEGIAIPHCRLENCSGVTGALVKLTTPIDFDSIDGEPVDLLFVLIVPTEATQEHLDTLSEVAELFGNPQVREKMRATKNGEELFQVTLVFMEGTA